MARNLNRDLVKRLNVGATEQTSRRGFLGKVGKAATAVTIGGVASGVSSAMFGAPAHAYSWIFNVPPYATLAPNGVEDVSDALNWFISVAPTGGLVQFPVFERYKVDGTVRVDAKTNLTLDFNGSTLWTANSTPYGDSRDRARSHLRIGDSDTVRVNHLNIVGPKPLDQGWNPDLQAQHGIEVESSAHVDIANYNCHYVWGDGLYVSGHGVTGNQSNLVSMTLFAIDGTGRHGTACTDVDGLTISQGAYSNVGRSTFDMETNDDTEVIQHIWMHDVTVLSHRLNFVASSSGGTVQHVLIEDITGVGAPLQADIVMQGGHAGSRSDWTFRNMTSDIEFGNPRGCLIRFWRVSNVTVENITQPLTAGRTPPMKVARFWYLSPAPPDVTTVDGEQVTCDEATLPTGTWCSCDQVPRCPN